MEPVETDRGLQVSGNGDTTSGNAVFAALGQLFTGLPVGLSSLEVRCNGCGTQLGEGDTVLIYAYRTVETPRWHLARCRCPGCAPDEITTPTLGTTECRFSARLAVVSDAATRRHSYFCQPTFPAVSSPQESQPQQCRIDSVSFC
jgi:ribosomal protein S27E